MLSLSVAADASNGHAGSNGTSSRRNRLREVGGDDLAEKLDSLHGMEVTDHSVFTYGTIRFMIAIHCLLQGLFCLPAVFTAPAPSCVLDLRLT